MGFNKRRLPELDDLKEIRKNMNSDVEFLRIYLYNPDALFGSFDSIKYMEDLDKKSDNLIQNKI